MKDREQMRGKVSADLVLAGGGIAAIIGLFTLLNLTNEQQVNGVNLVNCDNPDSKNRNGSIVLDSSINKVQIAGSKSFVGGRINPDLTAKAENGKLSFDLTNSDDNEIIVFEDGTINQGRLTTLPGNRVTYETPKIDYDISSVGQSQIEITASCKS